MKSLPFILFFTLSIDVFAQPRLVKDINTQPNFYPNFNQVTPYPSTGDYMAFAMPEGWWVTDGTTNGTHLINGGAPADGDASKLGSIGNNFIFVSAGTKNLTKYSAVTLTSTVLKEVDGDFFAIRSGDVLLFILRQNEKSELWKTDGTSGGTLKIAANLPADIDNFYTEYDSNGDLTYFQFERYDGSTHLWRTDETEEGTFELLSGEESWGFMPAWKAAGDQLYFGFKSTGSETYEFWTSDGTQEGTTLLVTSIGKPREQSVQIIDSSFFFWMGTALYVSDGTEAGTEQVTDPGLPCQYSINYKNEYYFVQQSFNPLNYALWKSDGTEPGTVLVMNLGGYSTSSFNAYFLFADKFFVALDHGGTGAELALSDGTAEGTEVIRDIFPGIPTSQPRSLWPLGNKIIFIADDGIHGAEFWITDGTGEGTNLLFDTNIGTANSATRFTLKPSTLGDNFFFAATQTSGLDLWMTDGAEPNTKKIEGTSGLYIKVGELDDKIVHNINHDLVTISEEGNTTTIYEDILCDLSLGKLDDKLLFSASSDAEGENFELWITDGTQSGTQQVREIRSGSDPGIAQDAMTFVANGKLVFTADDGSAGNELWITDGTGNGTSLLKDINAGNNGSSAHSPAVVGSYTYFVANDGTNHPQFWRTDGTEEGTIKAFDLDGEDGWPSLVASIESKLVFTLEPDAGGSKLMATDGTAAGTTVVKKFDEVEGNQVSIYSMVVSAGKLYFIVVFQNVRTELWVTDGTTKGTSLIKSSSNSGNRPLLIKSHDIVYFNLPDGLWRTAGTQLLTEKVTDQYLNAMIASNDKIYMLLDSELYGSELFVTEVLKFTQDITFEPSDKNEADGSFELFASATSELPIIFNTSSTDKISIEGTTVEILGPGRVTITATQDGNEGIEEIESSRTICITPKSPVIAYDETTRKLQSSAAEGNQWYLNGSPIEGATSSALKAMEDGTYSVDVTVDECKSETSNEVDVVIPVVTGFEADVDLYVFPNPSKDKLFIDWKGKSAAVSILDVRGNTVFNDLFVDKAELLVKDLAPGFYILKLKTADKQAIRKFVKE